VAEDERQVIPKTLLGAALALLVLSAQDTKPSCVRCSATYINKDEIQAYLDRVPAQAGAVKDQQVRAVDVGKSNVDIGVVYRGKQSGGQAVAEHDLVSEVYHIIDGSATLVTSPDIVGMKRRPATLETVRLFNGPGNNGSAIRNGKTYNLKTGDMVVIPAGTGHQFTKIDDHLSYVMVRIDPDKVTPLMDEAKSRTWLATPRTAP
jgi:mannose-6-phosphate isomerase-like protein (cupin superfamily)